MKARSRREQRGWTEVRAKAQGGPTARMGFAGIGGKPRVAKRRSVTMKARSRREQRSQPPAREVSSFKVTSYASRS